MDCRATLAMTIFVLLLSLVSGSAMAETMGIDGSVRANGIRLIFTCEQPVKFSTVIAGNQLQVTFDRSFSGSVSAVLSKLRSNITSAGFSNDGHTINFTLVPGSYKAHKFVSDHFVGLDVVKTGAPGTKTAQAPPVTLAAPVKQDDEAVAKATAIAAQEKLAKEKLAKERLAKAKLAKEKLEKEKLAQANLAKEKLEKERLEKERLEKEKLAKAKAQKAKTQVAARGTAPVIPVVKAPIPALGKQPDFDITFVSNDQGKSIIFPWTKDVAAAVFYRTGTLWVVFDAQKTVDTDRLVRISGKMIDSAEQLPSDHYTLLRLHGNALANTRVTKDQQQWVITIVNSETQPLQRIAEYKSDYSKGAFFPADNIAEPIHVLDPELQDELTIFPLYHPDMGVAPARHFIDFTVLKSSQGFAVVAIADHVEAKRIIPGIEITSPSIHRHEQEEPPPPAAGQGGTPEGTAPSSSPISDTPANIPHVESIYPFYQWYGDRKKSFVENELDLQNSIEESDHAEKSRRRLALAQFYFANGMIPEAMGMLQLIGQIDPPLMMDTHVKLLAAAIYFEQNRPQEAKNIYNSIPATALNPLQTQELNFWQSAIKVVNKIPGEQLDYLGHKDRFLAQYPKALQQQFVLLSIESALRANNPDSALNLIDLINIKNVTDRRFRNDLTYYKGVAEERKIKPAEALKLWEPLAADTEDDYNRGRASFATIKLKLTQQQMTPAEAIVRLNKLRYLWRGDDFEKDLLTLLGDEYAENKQYIEALRSWRQVINNFSNSEESLLLAAKMTRMFIYVFNNNDTSVISDLNAVALYYEFRDITPIGHVGDLIIQQLAFRMVKLDLLDRAASLLTHQVRYRLKDKERGDFGTKLAIIHLINKKPQQTIDVLDATEENITPENRPARLYIRAKALILLKKNDKAMALLRNDHSPEANQIRLNLDWATSKWADIISILEPVFVIPAPDAPLTAMQANDLLYLAVSYVMHGDQSSLTKLYDAYKDKLPKDSAITQPLRFLATDKGPVNYKSLDTTLGVNDSKIFIDKYRELIEKDEKNYTPNAIK